MGSGDGGGYMSASTEWQGPKPLKMKEVADKMSINKKNLIKMQEEDPTLQKLKQLKGTETKKGSVVSYEKRVEEIATPGRRDIPGSLGGNPGGLRWYPGSSGGPSSGDCSWASSDYFGRSKEGCY